jgi:hypothetical protein
MPWLVFALTPALGAAQGLVGHSSHASQQAQLPAAANLPVLVNGTEHPEQIPDELAYAHFILALAIPEKPSVEQARMRDAALAPIHLTATDRSAFMSAMAGVHTQLAFIDRELERLAAEAAAADRRNDLRVSRTRALTEAQQRIQARLSAAGRGQLGEYIRNTVKRNIIVYGDGDSTAE